MLQASLYAGRHATDCGNFSNSVASSQRRTGPSLRLAALLAFGQNWLQGGSSDTLNDHVLQDIGLSRADLEALKL